MEYQSQLDEAIAALEKTLDSNKNFRNITIDKESLHINNSRPQVLGTIGYLIVMIIIIVLVVAMGYESKTNLLALIIFSAIALFLLGRELYKIVRGEKILFLDFNAKQLEVRNVNSIFGRFIKKEKISFDEMLKVRLFENVIYHRYTATKWWELILTKKDGNEFILTSFNQKDPENFIAEKVKYLFDAIIWKENSAIRT
jgi:hypothetical protein